MIEPSSCPACGAAHDIGGAALPPDVACACGVTLAACFVMVPATPGLFDGPQRQARYWAILPPNPYRSVVVDAAPFTD